MKKILLGILGLMLVLRLLLPSVLLHQANAFLDDYSNVFQAHIGDLDLSFLRMAYRFENMDLTIRQGRQRVVHIQSIDVSLAWRELLKGRLLTDIEVLGAELKADPDFPAALKAAHLEAKNKKDVNAPNMRSKLFPMRIERLVIRDTHIDYALTKNAPQEERFILDEGQLRLSNLSPLEKRTKSLATFQANVMDSSKLKGVAELLIAESGIDWDMDLEWRQFDLTKANPFLRKMVPFTFTKGQLDVFMEAKSEKGAMVGYVKPFFRRVDVIESKEKFESPRHFLAEILTAVGNVIAQRRTLQSVATKIDFTRAGPGADFKVDILGAVANIFEHKFDQAIAPSVEDEIKLK